MQRSRVRDLSIFKVDVTSFRPPGTNLTIESAVSFPIQYFLWPTWPQRVLCPKVWVSPKVLIWFIYPIVQRRILASLSARDVARLRSEWIYKFSLCSQSFQPSLIFTTVWRAWEAKNFTSVQPPNYINSAQFLLLLVLLFLLACNPHLQHEARPATWDSDPLPGESETRSHIDKTSWYSSWSRFGGNGGDRRAHHSPW